MFLSLSSSTGPLSRSVGLRVAALLSLLAGAMAVISAPLWFSLVTQTVVDPHYQVVLADAATRLQGKTLLFAALACAGAAGFFIGFSRFRAGMAALALTTAMAVYGLIVPTVMQSLREPIAEIGRFIREQTITQTTPRPNRIILWRLSAPSLSFYATQVVKNDTPKTGAFNSG